MPNSFGKKTANQGNGFQPAGDRAPQQPQAKQAGFTVEQSTQEALSQTQQAAQQTATGAAQLMGHTILDQLNQARAYKGSLINDASELLAQELAPVQVASELWTATAGKLLCGMKSADHSFGLNSGVSLPSVPVLQQVSLAGLFPESSQSQSKQIQSSSEKSSSQGQKSDDQK